MASYHFLENLVKEIDIENEYYKLDDIVKTCLKSNIEYNKIIMFSACDFDQKLHLYSSVHNDVCLIDYKGY